MLCSIASHFYYRDNVEDSRYFHYYLCRQLKGGGMEINMCVKIKNMLFLALVVFGCTSCSIANEAMDEEKENNNVVIQDHSTEKPGEVSKYKVFRGEIRRINDLAKPEIYFPAGSDYRQLENETEEEESMWEDEENNYLIVEPGSVRYTTQEFYDTYETLLYDKKGKFRENFDEILEKENITSVSEKKAIETVNDIIEKNSFSIKDTKTYSLTKDNLTKLSRMFMSDQEYKEYIKDPTNEPMKRDFAKRDEGYLVVMSVCVGENVLYHNDYDYGERFYCGSYIWAIVNKEGLVTFQASGIYNVDVSEPEEIEVLSLVNAKQAMNQKFENIISANKVECKEIQQSYLAVGDGKSQTVSFIPVYVFLIEQKINDTKGGEQRQAIETMSFILDMENGKWIE